MSLTWVGLPGAGEALVAGPPDIHAGGGSRGGVVVLGELYGITDLVTDALTRLASAGYYAAAPDLFWRNGPRLALPYTAVGRERGFELFGALTLADVKDQISRTVALLADLSDAPRSIVGFSIGGYLALHAATEIAFDLVAAAYPGWTVHGGSPIAGPAPLGRAAAWGAARVLVVAGSDDHLVTPDLPAIEAALVEAGVDHRVEVIAGVPHGYACAARPETYRQDATEETWSLILDELSHRKPSEIRAHRS